MPVYGMAPPKILVRKDKSTGRWVVRPRRFGYPPALPVASFEAALLLASAFAADPYPIAA